MKKIFFIFSVIAVPLDFLTLLLAALAAYFLRFEEWIVKIRPVVFELSFGDYLTGAIVAGIVWLIIFAMSGLYDIRERRLIDDWSKIAIASSAGMMLVIVYMFFVRELFASRFIILIAWFFAVLFLCIERSLLSLIKYFLKKSGIGALRVALIGQGEASDIIASEMHRNRGLGYQVVERFPTFDEETAKKILEIHRALPLDEIIQVDPLLSRKVSLQIIEFTTDHHLIFKYIAGPFEARATNIGIHTIAGLPIIEMKKTKLEGWGRIYKRIFDIIGSLFLIILTSPIMLLTIIAIKLDSPGSIFFSSLDDGSPLLRIGQYGKPFRYFKFRSMKTGMHSLRYTLLKEQDQREGPLVKIKDDPRITKVGKFIRRFSIDELPEFFLVLKGDMSLVGPRPHLPEEVAKYQIAHKKVLTIKPGITGLAQTSGRADLSFEDEVRLDTWYIENWSIRLDLFILLKTPLVVFGHRGAY